MGAATALSAGGIALIDTHRTFFLPPQGGWVQQLKIRRASTYLINWDAMLYRYDAAWVLPNGEHKQGMIEVRAPIDDLARSTLESMVMREGGSPENSNRFRLSLAGPHDARYI